MSQRLSKDFILQKLSDHQKELATYGVEEIGLFGSYVRNEANIDSDVDLLVDINKGKKLFGILWRCAIIWKIF